MTISDNYAPTKNLGNDATTIFTASWPAINLDYVVVILEDVTTGVQVVQTVGVDYTVTSTDSPIVTFTTAPTSDNYVIIARDVPLDQVMPYRTSDGFNGKVVEDNFDKLTAITQDLQDEVKRSIKSPIGEAGTAKIALPLTADTILGVDEDGETIKSTSVTTSTLEATEQQAIDAAASAAEAAASAAIAVKNATPFGRTAIKPIKAQMDGHYGFNSALLETDVEGKWVIVYRYASGHELVEGSQIWAADTYDGGQTLVNERIIFTDAGYDTRNFVAAKMNGRIGILSSRRNEATTYTDPVFIYSDDDGDAWSSLIITAPSADYAFNFHGGLYQYPSSVGGDDANGFIAYSYGEGSDIDVLKTTDNGATWTLTQDVIVNGTFTLSEMAVSRIGTQDKWVMVIRTGQTNAAAATSTDMVTWSAANDTGLVFNGNPPALIYYEDDLWFFGFSRQNREIVNGLSSHIVFAKANGDVVFNGGGDFSSTDWAELTPVPNWASGYMFPFLINSKWYATFVCGEQATGGSSGPKASMLCLLGDFITIASSPYDTLTQVPRRNSLINGSFTSWSADESYTITDVIPVDIADGWQASGNAADVTVASKELFAVGQKVVRGNPTNYLKFASTTVTGLNSHYVSHKFGKVHLHNEQRCTLSFWAWLPTGSKTSISRIRTIQNFGTGGGQSSPVSFSIATNLELTTEPQFYQVQFNMPSIEGKVIGGDANDYVQLLFYPIFGENVSYDLRLSQVKLEQSPFASPFEQESWQEVLSRLRAYDLPVPASGAIEIVSGVLTIPNNRQRFNEFLQIDTEAAAATDDLDTISGGLEGQIIVLKSTSSSRDVTLKDGVGNLALAGDFTFVSGSDIITLIHHSTIWYEISRSSNV